MEHPLSHPTRLEACDALAALLPIEPFSRRLTAFVHGTLRMITRVQTHKGSSSRCWPRNSWERRFIHQAAELVGLDHVTLPNDTRSVVRVSKVALATYERYKIHSPTSAHIACERMRYTRHYVDVPALRLSHNPVRSFGLALAYFPDTWCTDLVRVVCSLSLDHPRFTKIIQATHKDQVAAAHMLTRESFLTLLLNP